MVRKVARNPMLARPPGQDVPTLFRFGSDLTKTLHRVLGEHSFRLNEVLSRDGTEAMEAPLPLWGVAQASVPAAADWEGAVLYVSDLNEFWLSDGVSWIRFGRPLVSQAEAEAGTENTKIMTALRAFQQNTARIASQAVAEAGTDNTKLMTPLRTQQLIDVQPAPPAAPIYRGHIDGLVLSNNATDAAHDIDIAAGQATDSTGAALMDLASTLVKQIDAAWAVGTNQGGLDTGTVAANTWYHVWLIRRSDTEVVDALFSTSATAPTMPTGYTQKRRIGAVRANASGNIIGFTQYGDEFLLSVPVADYKAANPGTAAVLVTHTVPLGVKVHVKCTVELVRTTGAVVNMLWTAPDQADTAPTSPLNDLEISTGVARAMSMGARRTNSSAQTRFRLDVSDASTSVRFMMHGWIDPRGRNA